MDKFYRDLPEVTDPFDPIALHENVLLPYLIYDLANITYDYLRPVYNLRTHVNMFLMLSSPGILKSVHQLSLEEHLHFVFSYWSPHEIKVTFYTSAMQIIKVIYYNAESTHFFLREFHKIIKDGCFVHDSCQKVFFHYLSPGEHCLSAVVHQHLLNQIALESFSRPLHQMAPMQRRYITDHQASLGIITYDQPYACDYFQISRYKFPLVF